MFLSVGTDVLNMQSAVRQLVTIGQSCPQDRFSDRNYDKASTDLN